MEQLRARGWQTIGMDELLAGRRAGGWVRGAFTLTFDDGFQNFADNALPVLRDCGFTATVFVVSRWVGRTNDWPGQSRWVPRLRLLDWDHIQSAAEAGIEIGAHSLTHPHLTRLSRAEAEREILECGREIELQIGRSVPWFAFPYGESSPDLRRIVAENFRAGFGVRLGFVTLRSSVAAIQRIDVYYLRNARLFSAIAEEWFGWYLQFRNWMRLVRSLEKRVRRS